MPQRYNAGKTAGQDEFLGVSRRFRGVAWQIVVVGPPRVKTDRWSADRGFVAREPQFVADFVSCRVRPGRRRLSTRSRASRGARGRPRLTRDRSVLGDRIVTSRGDHCVRRTGRADVEESALRASGKIVTVGCLVGACALLGGARSGRGPAGMAGDREGVGEDRRGSVERQRCRRGVAEAGLDGAGACVGAGGTVMLRWDGKTWRKQDCRPRSPGAR